MQQTERQRVSAQRIRRVNGLARSFKGLTKVVIQGDDEKYIELVDKSAIEKALLDAYALTLTQANNTPCMVSSLKDLLGEYGTSDNSIDITQGYTSALDGVDGSTVEVLKYLALKGDRTKQCLPRPLDVEECKQGWKRATEGTSSAMKFETHFVHWKAGYANDKIVAVHTGLANVPFMAGCSPTRWQFGVSSLLTKEHGNFQIHQLRTILLYKANYNFNNKILGRRMMYNAESHNILAL